MNANLFLDSLLCISAEDSKKTLIYEHALGKIEENEFKKKMTELNFSFDNALGDITMRDFDPPSSVLDSVR